MEKNLNPNRAVRQPFLANVIVTEMPTGNQMAGLIANLSRSGCYVDTATPFEVGVDVRVIISHDRDKVRALGKVAHAAVNKGMGIAFTSIMPDDETILAGWLADVGKQDGPELK